MKNLCVPCVLSERKMAFIYYSEKVLEKYFVYCLLLKSYKILFFQPVPFPHFLGINNLRYQGSTPNKLQIHITSYKDHTPKELL